jgi:hypothetical protein
MLERARLGLDELDEVTKAGGEVGLEDETFRISFVTVHCIHGTAIIIFFDETNIAYRSA